ncbi:MAG: winged helix-turn-helix domain-containing protein [Bacteroidota bacterium]
MKFSDTLYLLLRLHALIQRKGTGTPKALARRLNISRSALFRYLEMLESFDAPIAYCRHRQSYYYEEDFEFVFRAQLHTHTQIKSKKNGLQVFFFRILPNKLLTPVIYPC